MSVAAVDAGPSARTRAAWAKHRKETGDWCPLYVHLGDTAAVAEQLFPHWFSPSQKCVLIRALGDENTAKKVMIWLAAVHDIGKATPVFAMKVEGRRRHMENAGFIFPRRDPTPREQRAYPHGLAGQRAVLGYLELFADTEAQRHMMRRLAEIVGGHHGVFSAPVPPVEAKRLERFEDGSWKDARAELFVQASALSGLRAADWPMILSSRIEDAAQALLNGFLIVCDWIASQESYFPYSGADTAVAFQQRARDALRWLDFSEHWQPSSSWDVRAYFQERFGISEPRPVQRSAVDLARRLKEPSLMLVEAPTGDGKTEIGLACAEIFGARFGLHGALIALPTRATTNAMFGRVLSWLRSGTDPSKPVSVTLAHAKAQFDEEFQALSSRGGSVQMYDDEDAGEQGDGVVTNQWMSGRHRGGFADFVVSTIDQLLFIALKSRHLSLRHLGISGKVVVIDEVHAADDFMRTFLLRALQWLGSYGVPVVALSATLPPAQRAQLLQAYRQGALQREGRRPIPSSEALNPEIERMIEAEQYPLVTAIGATRTEQVAPEPSGRSTTYEISTVEDQELVDAVLRESQAGGCIAVVLNTVDRAQRVFSELRDRGRKEVELFHSRFTLESRNTRERDLICRLGPELESRRATIVVATQVMESSLDVDFDLIFTDMAPTDLLFQRMGRVHRHARPENARPASMRTARVVLSGGEHLLHDDALPRFDAGSQAVYGEAILLRSVAALRTLQRARGRLTVRVPDDVPELIRGTYREQVSIPDGWREQWDLSEEKRRERNRSQDERSKLFAIAPPGSEGISDWSSLSYGRAEEDPRAAAQVRDAEPSLEVVLVQERQGRVYPVPWLPRHVAEEQADLPEIEDRVAREIAVSSVTLPAWLTRGAAMDRVLDELEAWGIDSWQRSPWLRGVLPLVLDEELSGRIGGHRVRYDADSGLIVEREEQG